MISLGTLLAMCHPRTRSVIAKTNRALASSCRGPSPTFAPGHDAGSKEAKPGRAVISTKTSRKKQAGAPHCCLSSSEDLLRWRRGKEGRRGGLATGALGFPRIAPRGRSRGCIFAIVYLRAIMARRPYLHRLFFMEIGVMWDPPPYP
jgi:hypothetical protein